MRNGIVGMIVGLAGLVLLTGAREQVQPPAGTTPYRMSIRSTFPQASFPADNSLTNEGVDLGRALFFEGVLSGDGTVSCAKCHDPRRAFAEPRPTSNGIRDQVGRRNAQPLFNLAWRREFFWDGRAATLRDQVIHPITDPTEMGSTMPDVVNRINRNPRLRFMFQAAFGASATADGVAKALEQFLLTQISQDSPFDKAQQNEGTLTDQERRGFQLFMTEYDPAHGRFGADCFHCHGNVLFTNERYANNGLDSIFRDHGREEVTHNAWDDGMFKVPSLRNVALTAPYMHDGRFRTLREVVDHYDHGVVTSPTLDPNLAKHNGPMHLSRDDKDAIVAFLNTLTDETFVDEAMEQDRIAREQRDIADALRPPRRPPPPPPPRRPGF